MSNLATLDDPTRLTINGSAEQVRELAQALLAYADQCERDPSSVMVYAAKVTLLHGQQEMGQQVQAFNPDHVEVTASKPAAKASPPGPDADDPTR